jgi:hypothetical protein
VPIHNFPHGFDEQVEQVFCLVFSLPAIQDVQDGVRSGQRCITTETQQGGL